ncbi:MAG: ABC transporter substrate-binding protein, partial [Burkholderiaceae bacterium]
MKYRFSRIAALAALLWPLAAAAQITLQDGRGATLVLTAPPQRIVSLLPSLTESVCALGACAR